MALLIFQVGLVVAHRDRILAFAQRPRVKHFMTWLSAHAMPLFLWHSVGFAIFFA